MPPDGTSFGVYEAKTHLAALLDRVERGERLTITRNGRPVAEIIPAAPRRVPTDEEIQAELAELQALRDEIRSRVGVLDWERDIKPDRDAGRM